MRIAPDRVLLGEEARDKSSRFYAASIGEDAGAYLSTQGVWKAKNDLSDLAWMAIGPPLRETVDGKAGFVV